MLKQIKSVQNPLVKQIGLLSEKSRARKDQKLFIVEGKREISLAIKGGYIVKQVLYAQHLNSFYDVERLFVHVTQSPEIIEISREVHAKIAYRESTEGILAIVEEKEMILTELNFENKNPFVLVAEAPEKPGNIGALLRTADAAGVDAIFIANPKTDMFNPNVIRSSIGCVFTKPIYCDSSENIVNYLNSKSFNIYCAALSASVEYTKTDMTGPTAIVVGTEDDGLSEVWLKHSSQNIIIPMLGEIDSLNVSVSAGILLYEVVRQRRPIL